MDEHIHRVEELFSAAKTEFKHLEFYYFHNCVYDFMWKNNRRRYSEKFATWDMIRKYNKDYKLIFVGDATMSPYEILQPGGSVEYNNEEAGAEWLQRLTSAFPKFAWINPEPQGVWQLPAEHRGDPAADEPAHVPAHPARARRSDATAEQMTGARGSRAGAVDAAAGGAARRAARACPSSARTTPPTAGAAPSRRSPLYELEVDAPERAAQAAARLPRPGALPERAGEPRRSRGAELDRLVAAAPAQARSLLETEGYFDADVKVTRSDRRRPACRASRSTSCPGRASPSRSVAIDVDRRRCAPRTPTRDEPWRDRARQAARDLAAAARASRSASPTGAAPRTRRSARLRGDGYPARRLAVDTSARIDAGRAAGGAVGHASTAGRCSASARSAIEGHRSATTSAAIRHLASFAPGDRVQREAAARLPGAAAEARPVRRRVGRDRRRPAPPAAAPVRRAREGAAAAAGDGRRRLQRQHRPARLARALRPQGRSASAGSRTTSSSSARDLKSLARRAHRATRDESL